MRVGFTGTRHGMSTAQLEQLRLVLQWLRAASAEWPKPGVFDHGDGPGVDGQPSSDAQAADLARRMGFGLAPHPVEQAENETWAAAALRRDRVIASTCDVLVAAPRRDAEEVRSGTWATVRYAREAGKPIVMLSRGELRRGRRRA
jgi:hypothetical protein